MRHRVHDSCGRPSPFKGEGGVGDNQSPHPPAHYAKRWAAKEAVAKALGVAPSRLTLLRGQTARDKLFQID